MARWAEPAGGLGAGGRLSGWHALGCAGAWAGQAGLSWVAGWAGPHGWVAGCRAVGLRCWLRLELGLGVGRVDGQGLFHTDLGLSWAAGLRG